MFAQKGLARDIVRETDLATRTFYNYFDGPEQIFREVLEDFAARVRPLLREERLRTGRGLRERIYHAYRAYFNCLLAEPELFAMIRANAGTLATMPDPPGLAEAMADLRADLEVWLDEDIIPDALADSLDLLVAAFVGTAYHVALASASKLDANPRRSGALLLAPARGRHSRLGGASHVM